MNRTLLHAQQDKSECIEGLADRNLLQKRKCLCSLERSELTLCRAMLRREEFVFSCRELALVVKGVSNNVIIQEDFNSVHNKGDCAPRHICVANGKTFETSLDFLLLYLKSRWSSIVNDCVMPCRGDRNLFCHAGNWLSR